MGRHSRRGPADNGDTADIPVVPVAQGSSQAGPGNGRRRRETAPEGGAAAHTPARPSAPRARGGHPEQRERGGGWSPSDSGRGAEDGSTPPSGTPVVPRPRSHQPRQDYVDAFDAFDAFDTRVDRDPYASVTEWDAEAPSSGPEPDPEGPGSGVVSGSVGLDDWDGGREKRGRGLTYTGIAAAAVITVLAVVVAGQVTDRGGDSADGGTSRAADGTRAHDDSASRSDDRATPSRTAQAAPATYDQKMAKKYPLAADLKASGKFDAVGGFDKAPGRGQKFRYRIDVEKGLGLDSKLFAQAVQKTLNDKRSWAHEGARTFERISSGEPDFVITLASPGTTAFWCKKSGLDTTEDNVSCDSAATDRVMINAYRWAQGSKTYDDVLHGSAIHPYRQMLINHEVGHRLGFNHVTCSQDGALAPVMQQQTKFLTFEGITCKPNPWVYPNA
ncbi:DUF3152 domain-containing protein [Streptomyces sp. SID8379]|uniref:DUF3152 domain-containing protein n=1 Tax=Streptomyces sp. HmicA12 TaxID=1156844 RepID=UPI000477F45D|nr:DUF3152 domain-containing protein [Streptomyces sp. SID8379]